MILDLHIIPYSYIIALHVTVFMGAWRGRVDGGETEKVKAKVKAEVKVTSRCVYLLTS